MPARDRLLEQLQHVLQDLHARVEQVDALWDLEVASRRVPYLRPSAKSAIRVAELTSTRMTPKRAPIATRTTSTSMEWLLLKVSRARGPMLR